jgi:propionyl-CoA carboxylase alpha chain
MISKVLIANRGEIALRILRACRTLGIESVVAYSEADRESLPVQLADEAICIGPPDAKRSYLSASAVISAAVVTGCDAIHPGYGFLSEDEAFAEVVRAHGLTFIGPPSEVLERFASKEATRRLFATHGLPTIPGSSGLLGDDAHALEEAERIGYPVLVKPSAGGGGKGMRMVRSPRELESAIRVCRSEAKAAFGDDSLYLEKWLEDNRHVEVQVVVDRYGNGVHLGDRDCSVQRRHQKILEEAPSPAVDEPLRARLYEAAAKAARAIAYEGAGTVEFLLDGSGDFFFLEVNTRLQVEHPVTECVYGVDLVRLQIEIAEGARLPDFPPDPRGHAIEVRLYAEDPAQNWQPATGVLHTFEVPDVDAEFRVPDSYSAYYAARTHLRLDSGVVSGSEIGVHYDPMLAKLVAWAPSRTAAARRLAAALRRARIHGITSNRDLLVRILTQAEFLTGDTDTDFLTRHRLPTRWPTKPPYGCPRWPPRSPARRSTA